MEVPDKHEAAPTNESRRAAVMDYEASNYVFPTRQASHVTSFP
jgi:hypothetical protein